MESGIIFFMAQWFTIQPDLFGRIEDEVGELGESEKEFVSTVSRAYDQFAQDEIASLVHADFVQAALGRDGVFHVSHDSSAIDAREKGQRKPQTDDEKAQTSLGAQRNRTADENFALLPQHCDWGCKRDSKGKRKMWRGYKLHVSCADGDIPLAAILT